MRQLERSLDDIGQDFLTPLSSALISLELAARLAAALEAKQAIRRALTDVVYAANVAQTSACAPSSATAWSPPIPRP